MQVVPAAMLDLHSTRFKKVPPFLLDSLVEEPERRSVPDHLLESKIYSTLGRNEFVQASPAVLHFGGYELGKRHHQILKLINVSRRMMNLHILPPQTKHFSITYRKAQRLGPGLALTVNIYFLPDEWRYYYDCIRVHCQDDETLLVPVHGYAAMNAVHLPPAISFHGVSLGQSKHHVLPLRGRCPVAFQFRIVCSQSRQAFTVSPSSGVIPANGQVEVTVTFTPSDYGTARMRMDLLISELNAKPYNCVFTGTCTPGTPQISENVTQTLISSPKRCEDPVTGVTLPVSRKKRHLQTLRQNASKVTEYQNLRSPITLSSSHSMAAVLIQQPGRLKARDVREDLTGRTMNTRPVKEMLFEQKVQQNVVEEEANQLRWQIHVGSEPLCPALRQKISEERRTAAAECKIDMGSAVLERQYKRDAVCFSSWYILRTMDQRPVYQPQFDLYMNNLWADRHRTLKRFQQAARKVLIRRRIDGRLFLLEKLVDIMKPAHNGKEPPQGRVPDAGDLQVLTDCVSGLEFPYSPEEHHQESPSGLTVPKPADVLLKEALPYYNLKVPQHYQVMGYRRLGTLMASTSYKAPCLARALRTGAEDELMPVAVTWKAPSVAGPLTVLQPETPAPRIPCFAPPEPLLSPPDFPALHVFNPAPGLVDLKRPLSCSETDMEHHFCPLPKYPVLSAPAGSSGTAQRRFLSREEVLRGMMTWRKVSTIAMPLPSAAAGRTRWCDPFSVDLLPLEAPPALSDLPEEDEDNVVTRETEEKEVKVSLTPSMLRLQFPLRHTSPLDPKVDLIEPRAESAAPDEQSHLSEKVHEHLRRMKILSCNSALILI